MHRVSLLRRRSAPATTPPVPVLPGAEEFHHQGGPVGVLLCHGFTGSPQSLRSLAERLATTGYTVALPRLPGHGTVWQELNRSSWLDWYACVEQEFQVLRRSCQQVFVVGLSMGGALALRLAERYGDDVAGLVLINPAVRLADPRLKALPLLKRLLPSLAGISSDIAKEGVSELGYDRNPLRGLATMLDLLRDVHQHLSAVDQPLLLLRSRIDHVVDPGSALAISAGVASEDFTEIVLEHSFHVATLDHDAALIEDACVDFISVREAGR